MSDEIVKRATSDCQKEARKNAIMDAARSLFLEAGFFDVSMATIAKRAGLAKGTVYLYFKTKEEIFLALSTEELEDWLDDFSHQLLKQDTSIDNDRFIEILRESFIHRKVLQRLMSLLHLVLEKNITYEQAFLFKQNLKKHSEKVGEIIEGVLPYLPKGQGIVLLTTLHCLVVGWVQMSDPSPVLTKVLEHPEMAPFRFDMETNLLNSLKLVLMGAKAAAE